MKIIKFIKYILDYKKNQNLLFMPRNLTREESVEFFEKTYDITLVQYGTPIPLRLTKDKHYIENIKENALNTVIKELKKHIEINEITDEDTMIFEIMFPIGIRRKEEK